MVLTPLAPIRRAIRCIEAVEIFGHDRVPAVRNTVLTDVPRPHMSRDNFQGAAEYALSFGAVREGECISATPARYPIRVGDRVTLPLRRAGLLGLSVKMKNARLSPGGPGGWPTDKFVEAAYKSLTEKKQSR